MTSARDPHAGRTPPPGPALRAKARQALALPAAALVAQCEETFFVATGPGGQHRNKTATGVRLAHGPTGVVVTATERRSQAQNRSTALLRLRARLEAMAREPVLRKPTRRTRGSQERRLAAKRHAGRRKAERRGQLD